MKGDCLRMPISASSLRQKNNSVGPWFQHGNDDFMLHRQDSLDSDCRTESSFSPSPPTDNRMSVSELFNNLNVPRSSYLGNSNGSSGQGLDHCNIPLQSPPFSNQNSQTNRFQFSMPHQDNFDSSFFVDSPTAMRNTSFSSSAPGTPCTPGTPGTPPLAGFDPFSRSMMHAQARAIRGSPPYNLDFGSPGMEQPPLLSSRSISPADSESSSSNFDSVAELMASLSLNNGTNNNFINGARNNGGNGNNLFWPNGLSDQELSNLYALNALYSSNNLAENNRTLQMLLSSLFQRNLASNLSVANLLGSNNFNSLNLDRNSAPAPGFRNLPSQIPHDSNYFTWSGKLPERKREIREWSTKIFLGGIPWEVPEQYLISAFQQYGRVQVEWPMSDKKGRGFCYIIFENEKQVKTLLDHTHNVKNDTFFFELPGRRFKSNKPAQIIAWPICDSNYVNKRTDKLDARNTVFVGGLHGVINAECLCNIMEDTFEGVLYAGIDTDKYKYPQGSARVVFEDSQSYMRAVTAGYINIEVQISPVDDKIKITQRLQLKPYLEDSPCSKCHVQRGPYFCKDRLCFCYFCHSCWQTRHATSQLAHHQPLSRSSKNSRPSPGSSSFSSNITLQ